MIGSVFYIAVAQSFGFYNLCGRERVLLGTLGRKSRRPEVNHGRALWLFGLYRHGQSAIGSVILAYPIAIWLRRPFHRLA